MPRTFTPPLTPSADTAPQTAASPTEPALPDPAPSSATFYTTLPLILACQSSPPQWTLIRHTLSDPHSASRVLQLPNLHLLLQLATLNHALADNLSPLLDPLLSASPLTSDALLEAVHHLCRHMRQLAGCHSAHTALNRANAELVLHFKHHVVLYTLQQHGTLRQQLLDEVTHSLLQPASVHPLVRAFHSQLKGGRAGMSEYAQQHSYDSFKQQWAAYAALLLRTPTLSTLCQQLKDAHSTVLDALLPPPAAADTNTAEEKDSAGSEEDDVGESMDVEFVGEYVSERQLYEWLLRHRQSEHDGVDVAGVQAEWDSIKDGTHKAIVAWMEQRSRQSEQLAEVQAVV